MKSVVLDGFDNPNPIGNALKKLLNESGDDFSYFTLRDMNIMPCRSCGACGIKSPGKCIINDDIHEVMRAIAGSSLFIMITPIRFGGYSSQLKKAIDRTMPLGMPLYMVKKGHMLHPMRYGDKSLVVMGLVEDNIDGQEENFTKLVAGNALNMLLSYNKALIFKPSGDMADMEYRIKDVLKEVAQR